MDRRKFLRGGLTAAGAALVPGVVRVGEAVSGAPELVLRNALVFDGTGAPPFEGDVALEGGRISAVGRRLPGRGTAELELRGLALAPGFIDVHSHTELSLLVDPKAESKIRQGVTTEVVGQDGSSLGPWRDDEFARLREEQRAKYGVDLDFRDLPGFFRRLEKQGTAVNIASMVGAGTLRALVVGEDNRPATVAELARMTALVAEALAAGACGLSSGLEYTPGAFASTAELVALSRPLHGTGLPYASHMRNEDDELFAAVEEAVAVGRGAGASVQVSHLKAQGERNWWKGRPVLGMLEAARSTGVDVMFDRYPYVAYSTGLSNLFPARERDGGTTAFLARLADPGQRPRLVAEVQDKIAQLGSWDAVLVSSTYADSLAWARGKRLGALAKERGEEPYDLLVRLITEDRDRAGMVGFGMDEEGTERILAHPLGMICSDASALSVTGPLAEGSPHPRAFGSFPRVLGHYCRERRIMPLETAVYKMTGMAAARLRLRDRGRIAPGLAADLVAFDPNTVADRATFEKPQQYPVGIPHVLVAGKFVVRDGNHTGTLAGRGLRVQG
jgi:N-acyl-D-amino-acid deacylase